MRLKPVTQVPNQPGYEWATIRWLRRQIYENRLPSYKVEGLRLVDLDDLDAKVAAGREGAVAT